MPARNVAAVCGLIVNGLVLWPGPAAGAPIACSPRDMVLGQLSSKFQEVPVAIGLANNGGLLELLSAPGGKTWTIVVTMPNGITCLVAAGEDWQEMAAPEPGEPS